MNGVVKEKRNTKMTDVVWTGTNKSELEFDVIEKPLEVDGFVIPDKKAIFRVGSEFPHYFATVSKKYKIVKHEDIVEKLEEGMNFKNASVKTILSKNGAQMQRMYTINDYSVPVRKGDSISPVIRITNSYDGLTAVGFHIDALRLVCSNGMISTRKFMSMNYKHFGSVFNINVFSENAKKLLRGFKEYSLNWKRWTEESINEDRAKLILQYFPKRFQPLVEARYAGNYDGTKWGFYNAFTASITHDYTPNKGATSADLKKIILGGEVTKIFADDWYWSAPKEEILLDLERKNKIEVKEEVPVINTREKVNENIVEVEATVR